MIQEKDIDLITRFFDLALSDDELKELEQRLLNDVEFREKLETYKEANHIVNEHYLDDDKQAKTDKWKAILKTDKTIKSTKKTNWKWIGAIAAGFALLFSFWVFNNTLQEPDLNKLLANAWDKKIGLDQNITRSASKDSIKDKITIAFKTYNKKDYQSTIHQLSNYKTATLYYEDVLLLRGLSYYKKNKIDIALKTLDTLSNYHTGKKSKVANWYQGLIYLEQGNIKAASKFLKLPNNNIKELQLLEH